MSIPPKNEKSDDAFLDQALRPETWEEFIGQSGIKSNLKILLQAAEERGHPAEHILFYGPPGLGKTTLANLIAKETNRQLKITSGPAIEKVGDLASILTNLSRGDILFIDEIHRLNKTVEEVLYPAMERGVLDIIIGKGPSARTVELDIEPFTLVAATTRISLLSSPLRSRFSGGTFRLDFYNEKEISQIVKRSAELLKVEIEEEAINEISKRSRFTPRTANYFLKRCRDFAQVSQTSLSKDIASKALALLEVDELGLTAEDRKMLSIIIEKFDGGPVGLSTLGASLHEEEGTIEAVIEPYLLQIGLLERTPRGRSATKRAYEHLGYDYKDKKE